jgi:hypothetical protein
LVNLSEFGFTGVRNPSGQGLITHGGGYSTKSPLSTPIGLQTSFAAQSQKQGKVFARDPFGERLLSRRDFMDSEI